MPTRPPTLSRLIGCRACSWTPAPEWSLAFLPLAATLEEMKQSLDHLPEGKRRELEFVVGVIRESFAKAIAYRTQPRFRSGKLLKIVLFGSYARGDWVDDPIGRYHSDYDLPVVVDHEDLTDVPEFWVKTEGSAARGAVGREAASDAGERHLSQHRRGEREARAGALLLLPVSRQSIPSDPIRPGLPCSLSGFWERTGWR